MTIGPFSPERIHISSIVLDIPERISEKVLLASDGQNTNVLELVVYESIFNSYLTAELSMMEDQGIINSFKGTEKIVLTFKSTISPNMPMMEKSFRVDSITDNIPVAGNQNMSLMKLHLTEDVAYFDKVNKINRGYQGYGENIIRKILRSELNKEVIITPGTKSSSQIPIKSNDAASFYYWKPSYQGDIRYIAPWQSPFEIVNTILNRMTTEKGLPYFCYSTLNQNNLVLTDLESIIQRETLNPNQPFVYSRAQTSIDGADAEDLAYTITAMHEAEKSHAHLLARLGAYGSRLETVNVNSSKPNSQFINMEQQLANQIQQGVYKPVGERQPLNVFDNLTLIYNEEGFPKGGKSLSEYIGAVNFVVTGDTIDRTGDDKSVLSFAGQIKNEDHILKVVRSSILRYLLANYITIQMPGMIFSTPSLKTTVGNIVDINILKSDDGKAELSNPDRSGSFLILRTKHVFNVLDGLHNVQMDVAKVGSGG